MSILFYRRPDYLGKSNTPITSTECARYVDRAKKSERAIPKGLTYQDVMSNKSLPPCSLSDFMDYLVYVEHNAENLQFYLWYQDYCKRFDALPASEKALAPEWKQPLEKLVTMAPPTAEEMDASAKKDNKITKRPADIMNSLANKGFDNEGALSATFMSDEKYLGPKSPTKSDTASVFSQSVMSGGTTVLSNSELAEQAGMKWQPFSVQPMRDELNNVARHYLAINSPRELNLSHKDRSDTFAGLQHTTHPSAMFPAAKIAETTLRGQSHPNFIRWSICNGNKPKIFFVRTMGVSHIILGLAIGILLTLSSASRWWRIFAAPVMFVGFSTMIAAYKGLCVILHKSHVRNLHPWELPDLDEEAGRRSSYDSTAGNRTIQLADRAETYAESDNKSISKFRPSSLQTFGGRNSFGDEDWVQAYQKKPLISKIWERSVWTQDEALRVLQDKIVLGANLWGLILTLVCTAVFVILPACNLY